MNYMANYTSRIIKAGALIEDTKTLFSQWDEDQSIVKNLDRIRQQNLFGKASRKRIEDMLLIFRRRYLKSESQALALSKLVKGKTPDQILKPILLYYTAQADQLLMDIMTESLSRLYRQGLSEVAPQYLATDIGKWVDEGKTTSPWSNGTISRVVQGLLATLRDFGVLEGQVKKRIASTYLPPESFSFITFELSLQGLSGERLIYDPSWKLFFLDPAMVERLLMIAHQENLLHYSAAGSLSRIDFPADTLEGYADALVTRPVGPA